MSYYYQYLLLYFLPIINGENITETQLLINSENLLILQDITNGSTNVQSELIDYYDMRNDGGDGDVSIPPDIYPDPENIISQKEMIKEFEILPADNNDGVAAAAAVDELADTTNKKHINLIKNGDLKDHNVIHNIMYIYYGSNGTLGKNVGGSIIVIGAVIALAAQILSIILSMLRIRRNRRSNPLSTILLNFLSSLCASNFIFVVGVQATKLPIKCEITSVILHYLHMTTAIWCCYHIYTIYNFVINDLMPDPRHANVIAYGGTAIFVLFCLLINCDSYETSDYCWMSVQRGMIINFMIPISVLIIITTILGTLTLRTILSKQRDIIVESIEDMLDKCQKYDSAIINTTNNICCQQPPEPEKVCDTDLKRVDFYDSKFDLGALSLADLSFESSNIATPDYQEFKQAIKSSLFFQPAYAVCWFLGVIALENRESSIMPIVFIICYNIMNWYLLYCSSAMSPFMCNNEALKTTLSSSIININSTSEESNNQPTSCTDTIPLLFSGSASQHQQLQLQQQKHQQIIPSVEVSIPHTSKRSIDELYHLKIRSWETSMENLDCISTISN